MLSGCNSQWRQCGPSEAARDLQEKKRLHKAWMSRIYAFIHGPSGRKISRQETNHPRVQESLESLLSQKWGQIVFREFLKTEFCEENLDFWLACQDFKNFEEPEELQRRAKNIYEEFVRKDAPKQVNLDFNTSHIISQSLQRPSALCFVTAQRKIFSLMENGSFPRFLQSEYYQGLFHTGSGGKEKVFKTKSAGDIIQYNHKLIPLSSASALNRERLHAW
ncbi:regulator of G-protein signaling 21-like [Nelusetta ayraudi]|uniref:regulator of G-protein signaling 21-like n=1 Tax=Nelusetta ayraudi TaxID=303726 RepID=UPI003F724715